MVKIVLRKKEKKKLIVLTNKHKIKEIIGIIDNDNLFMNINKLKYYIKSGYSFSKSSLDLIYKKLITNELFINENLIL